MSSQFSFAEGNFVAVYRITLKDYSVHHCWMKVCIMYHLKSSDSAILLQASKHIAHTVKFGQHKLNMHFPIHLSVSSPRNLTFISYCIGSSPNVIWKEALFCWLNSNIITLVFFKFKDRPIVMHHLFILSSAFKDLDWTSWKSGPEISMLVLSVYNNGL